MFRFVRFAPNQSLLAKFMPITLVRGFAQNDKPLSSNRNYIPIFLW